VYRDLVDISSRNRKLRLHFSRILKRASQNACSVLRGLEKAGVMRATREEIDATATNITLVATFWMSYNAVRGGIPERASEDLTQGIYQVMMLLTPFLRDAERAHLVNLARAYIK
jgi:Bacterial transcriptional repressor